MAGAGGPDITFPALTGFGGGPTAKGNDFGVDWFGVVKFILVGSLA